MAQNINEIRQLLLIKGVVLSRKEFANMRLEGLLDALRNEIQWSILPLQTIPPEETVANVLFPYTLVQHVNQDDMWEIVNSANMDHRFKLSVMIHGKTGTLGSLFGILFISLGRRIKALEGLFEPNKRPTRNQLAIYNRLLDRTEEVEGGKLRVMDIFTEAEINSITREQRLPDSAGVPIHLGGVSGVTIRFESFRLDGNMARFIHDYGKALAGRFRLQLRPNPSPVDNRHLTWRNGWVVEVIREPTT